MTSHSALSFLSIYRSISAKHFSPTVPTITSWTSNHTIATFNSYRYFNCKSLGPLFRFAFYKFHSNSSFLGIKEYGPVHFFSLHFILKEQAFTIKEIYLTKSKYQVSFSCFGEFPFLGMNIGCMCFLLFWATACCLKVIINQSKWSSQ